MFVELRIKWLRFHLCYKQEHYVMQGSGEEVFTEPKKILQFVMWTGFLLVFYYIYFLSFFGWQMLRFWIEVLENNT